MMYICLTFEETIKLFLKKERERVMKTLLYQQHNVKTQHVEVYPLIEQNGMGNTQ